MDIVINDLIESIASQHNAVGVAVSVVDLHDNIYRQYYGTRKLGTILPINEHTIFATGSIAKTVTALAIMQMNEEHRIDINNPIQVYIPEIINSTSTTAITPKHFMSHTVGYPQLKATNKHCIARRVAQAYGLEIKEIMNMPEYFLAAREDITCRVNAALGNPLFEPGSNFTYQNEGYSILSEVVRCFGGYSTYEDYILERIFSPLSMKRSMYDTNEFRSDDNRVELYDSLDGDVVQIDINTFYSCPYVGMGALNSTLYDLEQLGRLFLAHGIDSRGMQVVNRSTIDEMEQPRVRYFHNTSYGYGLFVGEIDGTIVCGNNGSGRGISSSILWSREMGKVVIALCNTTSVPVSLITWGVMMHYKGKSPNTHRSTYRDIAWDIIDKQDAQGIFSSGDHLPNIEIVLECSELLLCINGRYRILRPVERDLLIIEGRSTVTEVIVHRDDRGHIWAITYNARMAVRLESGIVSER